MELPIFPLNGAVLFPDTNLPLNIFEKRYVEMVDYALARDRCIGMIQTDTNNQLYNIGCVGKINNFNETNDGRYLISLQGINCFKIIYISQECINCHCMRQVLHFFLRFQKSANLYLQSAIHRFSFHQAYFYLNQIHNI